MNFRRGKEDKNNKIGFDPTPLVDMMFLLIIFVMLSATTMQYSTSIRVNLPKAASDRSVIKKNIIITINEKNIIYVDGKSTNRNNLYGSLKSIWNKNKDATVIIEADKRSTHGTVVFVMDQCRRAGFENFAISVVEE
jgi:biopolymer transport protein ExbD